jgi:hypothetical protein
LILYKVKGREEEKGRQGERGRGKKEKMTEQSIEGKG